MKLPTTGYPSRDQLIIVLAQCSDFPDPGVPLYRLIISVTNELEPAHQDGIQIEQTHSAKPGKHNSQTGANRKEPVEPAQVGQGREVTDKLLERGEGQQIQELLSKSIEYGLKFHGITPLSNLWSLWQDQYRTTITEVCVGSWPPDQTETDPPAADKSHRLANKSPSRSPERPDPHSSS